MIARISMAALIALCLCAPGDVAAQAPCRSIFCDFFSNDAPPTDDGSPCLTLCRLTGLGGRTTKTGQQEARQQESSERIHPSED